MISKENIHLTLVTSNMNNKERPFRYALKGWQFEHRLPLFDEFEIHKNAPQDETRATYISKEKAKQDAIIVAALCGMVDMINTGAKVTLYTDSVQRIVGEQQSHEKPKMDALTWAQTSPDAIAQSGRQVEIVTGLSMLACSEEGITDPQTVRVRVMATMKPFTRAEIVAYAMTPDGARTIETTAGGISLANGGRHFYDETKPLFVLLEDEDGQNKQVLHRFASWGHVSNSFLKPFITGAFEPAVMRVVEKTLGKKVV